jgi:hypothetical protein
MMLATVEAVTKADAVWEPRRLNSDVAAQATASESIHAAPPLKSSGTTASLRDALAIMPIFVFGIRRAILVHCIMDTQDNWLIAPSVDL